MTGASQEPCKANWAASAETLNSNKPGSTCTSSWCKGEPQARLSDLGGALPMPSSQHHLPCKMGWCCLPPGYGPATLAGVASQRQVPGAPLGGLGAGSVVSPRGFDCLLSRSTLLCPTLNSPILFPSDLPAPAGRGWESDLELFSSRNFGRGLAVAVVALLLG